MGCAGTDGRTALGEVKMFFSVSIGKDAIDRIEETLKQHSDYLVELDSAIGDADHGTNMCR